MNKSKITGLAAISFLFSIAGIIISNLLLKEDVTSTAHTLFEYFPAKFGVTPASTWEGAVILGIFTSVLQVVSASVAFSRKFPLGSRIVAALCLAASFPFDNWTDVIFRSGDLHGNMRVAYVTTFAFYTIGSEVTQGLSWLVLIATWREAISDFMWGAAKFNAGRKSISAEWIKFKNAANRKENDERGSGNSNETPKFPYKPFINTQNEQKKPHFTPPPHIIKQIQLGNQNKSKKPD